MTNKTKLKYFLLTIVLIGLCALTTAFPIKAGSVAIDLTYALLLLTAFLFGGWVCGIAGVFGICLFNLLKNNSIWLTVLGLVLGLAMGVMAWLTKKLLKKDDFDKSAPMIAAGAFFLGLGAILTTVRCSVGEYYTVPRVEILMTFGWALYVLPFIVGAAFLVIAFIWKKVPDYVQKPVTYSAMIAPASMLLYSFVAALCSLKKGLVFKASMANAFNDYIDSMIVGGCVCILAAIALYIIFSLIIILRRKLRNAL